MRRLTASLAVGGIAALALTGVGTAAKPVVSATLTACVDQQGDIVATVSWQGRVTNGTFVATDSDGLVQSTTVPWDLGHGERSGSVTASLGPNLGYERLTATLYASRRDVAVRTLFITNLPGC